MKYLLALIVMCLSQFSFAGSVYKCQGASGTIYQASPCAGKAKTTIIGNLDKSSASNPNRTVCDAAAAAAEAVMTARQNGVDMVKLMHNVTVNQENEASKELAKAMVVSAYERSRYSTPEVQRSTIQDFKNENYLNCTKAYKP